MHDENPVPNNGRTTRIFSKRITKRIITILSVIIFLTFSGFIIWTQSTPKPMTEALNALTSDDKVLVSTDEWLVFEPKQGTKTGFIFYPGGRADPRSYAPTAKDIASEGFLVIIPRMPLNLAVLGSDRANEIINYYKNIENWTIGGHSLGGAMAARYVYYNPEKADGLILWAAYPAKDNDLSDSLDLQVLSIYCSNDGLATVEEVESTFYLLPEDSIKILIEGGNHAQFGWYGDQSGDRVATITSIVQQEKIVKACIDFLVLIDSS